MTELPSTPTPEPVMKPEFSIVYGFKRDSDPVNELFYTEASDTEVEEMTARLLAEHLDSGFFRSVNDGERDIAILNHILYSSGIIQEGASDEQMRDLETLRQKAILFWHGDASKIEGDALEIRDLILSEMELSEQTDVLRLCDQLRSKLPSHKNDLLKAHRLVATMLMFARQQS